MTPSDLAPARLSQQQIDELTGSTRIADVLPLTPLQQGLLFHAGTAEGSRRRCVCGAAGHHRDRRAGSRPAARCGADRGQPPSQPGWPDSATQFDEPVQIIPADPVPPWQYVELDGGDADVDEQIERLCAAERAAVCDLADQPLSGRR